MSSEHASSPRRGLTHQPPPSGPSSPRHTRVSIASRLPSFSENESRSTNVVLGFSPPPTAGLQPLPEATPSSPKPGLNLASTNFKLAHLSPQLSTPIEQTFPNVFHEPPSSSPRHFGHRQEASSPKPADFPPRSRRNSAAIVSISLSSRSRSRTPRGSNAPLPGQGSGNVTPSKGANLTPKNDDATLAPGKDVLVQMGNDVRRINSWTANDALDDWQPTGGLLLDEEEDQERWDDEDDYASDDGRKVEDILPKGTLFGEGLTFQDEVIRAAVGRLNGSKGDDAGTPLRRGGSEAPKALRGQPGVGVRGPKKVYEVVRQLGSGSYAVVYLVREKSGRRREYALKCLSKQDLTEEQIETQLFEAMIHLSLPIHKNIVTLHQTLQTNKWLFLMLELCPGEDLFFWLEKSRDASPPPANAHLEDNHPVSSSKFSSSSIPFSSSQLFSGLNSHFSSSPHTGFTHGSYSASPASLLFAHNNNHSSPHFAPSQTPPTPSLLSAFSANTLLSSRRLRLIASMFSQMCEAVAVCHEAGVSHRDIKPENFICCDSVELETSALEDTDNMDFGPQAKRKVIVKLTDFGLSTTEEDSGDVECGSKPYMSYECRNNLGPTYYPPAADVWSLGIVLINMLFHRNPWKDPTPGDPNFDNFLRDPTGFLLAKFNGIGKEVGSYLACHVLCTEVEDRVTAKDFGIWVKNLPEMIGGRKAVHQLRMAKLESHRPHNITTGFANAHDLFVKSPIEVSDQQRKASTSALTSTAPMLSQLPPPTALAYTLPTPDLISEDSADPDEMKSATTVDEQPTPADTHSYPSPVENDNGSEIGESNAAARDPSESRSLSTHKRRKRGVRKGKAAQAALAAASSEPSTEDKPTQAEKDAMLRELAAASQTLARDLSKHTRSTGSEIDPNDRYDFPPLGTTPSQVAQAKKSKWKDLMKGSANPELAALAKRVAERDGPAGSFGTWSAPAQLQHDPKAQRVVRPSMKQTQTISSVSGLTFGLQSGLSSRMSSPTTTTSSAGAQEDLERRVKGMALGEDSSGFSRITEEGEDRDERDEPESRGREKHKSGRKVDKEETSRARRAAIAAAALTGGFEPMGAFGANRPTHHVGHPRAPVPPSHKPQHQVKSAPLEPPVHKSAAKSDGVKFPSATSKEDTRERDRDQDRSLDFAKIKAYPQPKHDHHSDLGLGTKVTVESTSTRPTLSSSSTAGSQSSTSAAAEQGPNKPKLKGQIQSLAKMLSGLKTKGKD